jgi:hypothetical protein
MKKPMLLTVFVAFGLLSVIVSVLVGPAAYAEDFVPPVVFQAAGPAIDPEADPPQEAVIQGVVDAFRAALGEPNNGNAAGPRAVGRREINWDGGGNNDTTDTPVTPFNVFLNTRVGQFTTRG